MGFFSKVFRGVKKVFKKIGKGVKKVVTGVGKFMNKIGIVGQIALMFIPGVGPMLSSMFKGMGGVAAGALKAMGPIGSSILRGAQFVVGKAGKFITAGKNAFGTITEGIGGFVKEFTKTGLNKLGLDPTKFGFADIGSKSFSEAWGKVTTDITNNASQILDPFKSSVTASSNTTLKSLSETSYNSIEDIQRMNPTIKDWNSIDGQVINLDMDNIAQYTGTDFIGDLKATVPENTTRSLLRKYEANPVVDSMTKESAADFMEVYNSQVPSPLTETSSFLDTKVGGFAKDVAIGGATNIATQSLMSAVAGDPPEPPLYGSVVNAGNVQVTGAGGAVDYGIGANQMLAASIRPPQATGLYDGSNTYAANLKAYYSLS